MSKNDKDKEKSDLLLGFWFQKQGFEDEEIEKIKKLNNKNFKGRFGKPKGYFRRSAKRKYFYDKLRQKGFPSKEALSLASSSEEKILKALNGEKEKGKGKNESNVGMYKKIVDEERAKRLERFKKSQAFKRNEWFYTEVDDEELPEETGFTIIEAQAGMGKTILAVKMALEAALGGRKVVSNVFLNLYYDDNGNIIHYKKDKFYDDIENGTYKEKRAYLFKVMNEIFKLEDYLIGAFVLIDELQLGPNARTFASKKNKDTNAFEAQYRKRNIFFVATTQGLQKVDVLFRNAMTNHVKMIDKQKTKKGHIFIAKVTKDVQTNPTEYLFDFDGIPLYPIYKTRQIVEGMDDTREKEEGEE